MIESWSTLAELPCASRSVWRPHGQPGNFAARPAPVAPRSLQRKGRRAYSDDLMCEGVEILNNRLDTRRGPYRHDVPDSVRGSAGEKSHTAWKSERDDAQAY
jgi:hypothetical protein